MINTSLGDHGLVDCSQGTNFSALRPHSRFLLSFTDPACVHYSQIPILHNNQEIFVSLAVSLNEAKFCGYSERGNEASTLNEAKFCGYSE